MLIVSIENKLTTQTAKILWEKIRTNQQQVQEKLLNHRYLKSLEQGQIPGSVLHSFIGNQYHLMHSVVRANAQMQQRFANTELRN